MKKLKLKLKQKQETIKVSELLELCNSLTTDNLLMEEERVIIGRLISTVLEKTGNEVKHGVAFERHTCGTGELREYFMSGQ